MYLRQLFRRESAAWHLGCCFLMHCHISTYIFLQTLYCLSKFFSLAIAILSFMWLEKCWHERYTTLLKMTIFLLLVYISFRSSISIRYNCRALSLSGFHFILCLLWLFFLLSVLCVRAGYIFARGSELIYRRAIFVRQRQNVNICRFVVTFFERHVPTFLTSQESGSKDANFLETYSQSIQSNNISLFLRVIREKR